MLFCAAQAPELFGRDQRYGVLPLYFSRALTRTDYALAKVGGLMAAVFVVEVLAIPRPVRRARAVAADPITGLSNELPQVPLFVLQAALVAGLLGGLASLVAAWTPRRAYATAAIIAVFIIPPIIVALVGGLTNQDLARAFILFSPADVLDGTNAAIFGSIPDSPVVASLDLPGWIYVGAAAVEIAVAVGLTSDATCGSRRDRADGRPRPASRRPRRPPSRSTTSRAGTATSWPSTTSRSRSVPG